MFSELSGEDLFLISLCKETFSFSNPNYLISLKKQDLERGYRELLSEF